MQSVGLATTRVLQTQPGLVASSLASASPTSAALQGATTSIAAVSSGAVVSQVRKQHSWPLFV